MKKNLKTIRSSFFKKKNWTNRAKIAVDLWRLCLENASKRRYDRAKKSNKLLIRFVEVLKETNDRPLTALAEEKKIIYIAESSKQPIFHDKEYCVKQDIPSSPVCETRETPTPWETLYDYDNSVSPGM